MDSSAAPWDDETDLPPATPAHAEYREYLAAPWAWREFVRRVKDLTKGEKYILHCLSDAARKTGMGARPGLARLAVEAEASYTDVADALRHARELGLLWIAAKGTRSSKPGSPDHANEYWLILHPDVQDRATVINPDVQRAEAETIRQREREKNARKYVDRETKKAKKSPPLTGGVKDAPEDHLPENSPPLTGGVKDDLPPLTGGVNDQSPPLTGGASSEEHSTGGAPQKPGGNLGGKREPLGRSKNRCEHGLENSKLRQCSLCRRGLTTTGDPS